MDAGSQFLIIVHDGEISTFPASGELLSVDGNVQEDAIEFLQGIHGGSFESCPHLGLQLALNEGREATLPPAIVYAGAARGACPELQDESEYLQQAAEWFLSENQPTIPVHVAEFFRSPARTFLRTISLRSGGSYISISPRER